MQLDLLYGAVDAGLEETLPVPEPESAHAPVAAIEDYAVNSGLGFGRHIAGHGSTFDPAKESSEHEEIPSQVASLFS
jgi:hypothetical protein